ncbi:MAG: PhzF family phenazine biosynthesis protein [Dehalococcoidia bacterium]
MTTDVHVLRVFTDAEGRFGNLLGVVLNTASFSNDQRQAIAAELGYSETVFVDDVASASLRIFTPKTELPLAGHPLVGTAWLLGKLAGAPVDTLRPQKAAPVATWQDDSGTWIRARVSDAPDWGFVQLDTPAAVEALPVPPGPEYVHHSFWAWIDEPEGNLRARVFASWAGVPEDPATGSAALRLVDQLQRPIRILQGQGCIIQARPNSDGTAEVGGFVIEDEMRHLA